MVLESVNNAPSKLPEIVVTLETVTPEVAERFLSRNKANRPVTDALVKRYAKAMADGRWNVNGQTIIFDWNEDMRNGQHRCLGCIMSGVSFSTLVVHGIDPKAFSTMDTGRRRTAADVVGIDGRVNHHALASAVRWVMSIRSRIDKGHLSLDADQILENLRLMPGLDTSVSRCLKLGKLMPRSVAGALHYEFSKKSPLDADTFFDDLFSGAGLDRGDPVFSLRERLVKKRMERGKLPETELVTWVIRAWNKRREGGSMFSLRGTVKTKAKSEKGEPGQRLIPEIG